MPHKKTMRKGMGRRRKRGGSFKSFISGANNFLKKTGILSKLGKFGSQIMPGKFGEISGMLGNAAGSLGYGRRRRRCGGALRLARGALYR
jgi:hypothetical protein